MIRGTMRTLRYARSWKSGADVEVRDVEFDREGVAVPASLVLPVPRSGRLPAWIALGGVSRMGRHHPQLVRFASSMAATGAAVLVPELPEWKRLDITPRPAVPTIRGCIEFLESHEEIEPGKVGLIGFSFGAPQVAIAAAHEDLADKIAGIALFGGYCCLKRTLRCQLTGEHEWDGVPYTLDPDPYGRWVVGSNHLTKIPGHEGDTDIAEALHQLASAASGKRVAAWEPEHDTLIGDLREALPQKSRPTFDLYATPAGCQGPDVSECREMADGLAVASRRAEPLLAPGEYLQNVSVPVRLLHGEMDRLIPFTEGMRLRESLPPDTTQDLTVTGLFHHSADRTMDSRLAHLRETAVFFQALRRVITTV